MNDWITAPVPGVSPEDAAISREFVITSSEGAPIDLTGVTLTGVFREQYPLLDEYPTPLNKQTLLQDSIAERLGLSEILGGAITGDSATVNNAIERLIPVVGSYAGNGSATRVLNLGFKPQFVLVFVNILPNPPSGNSPSRSEFIGFATTYGFNTINLGSPSYADAHIRDYGHRWGFGDIAVADTGIEVTDRFNLQGQTYSYIAWR